MWLDDLKGNHPIRSIYNCTTEFLFCNQSLEKSTVVFVHQVCHLYRRAGGLNKEAKLRTIFYKCVGAYLLSVKYHHLICILKISTTSLWSKLMSPLLKDNKHVYMFWEQSNWQVLFWTIFSRNVCIGNIANIVYITLVDRNNVFLWSIEQVCSLFSMIRITSPTK